MTKSETHTISMPTNTNGRRRPIEVYGSESDAAPKRGPDMLMLRSQRPLSEQAPR